MAAAVGAGLAVVGTVFTLGGAALTDATDRDGTVHSDRHELTTQTRALVSSAADLDGINDVADVIGDPRVGVSSSARQGEPDVFVGIGPSKDVDRYLAGADIDKVTDIEAGPFSDFDIDKERRAGTATPKPPATQSFWVAQSAGRTANVNWKLRDGSYKLVVMNVDGSRKVVTDTSFEARLPALGPIAIASLVAGIAALVAGIAMLLYGLAGPPRPATTAPSPA